MLTGRTWFVAGAALVAVIVAFAFFKSESSLPTPTKQPDAGREPTGAAIATPAPDDNRGDVAEQAGREAPAVAVVDEQPPGDSAFRVNASGELVVDEQTRLNIEALMAQTEPRELYVAVQEHTENLPPAAARLAEELVQKFVNYQQAQRQAYPPDDAPHTPEEAIRQLEGLHALREAHFGPDVARQFYGKEEIIAREMIEVMRVESDQSLTAQEKLERAQRLREQLPNVAAIERSNRESVTTQKQED